MQLSLALLALLACSSSASPIFGTCNATTLKTCFDTYIQNFNISTNPLADYVSYATARAIYLDHAAVPGQKNVCQWQHELEKCLGSMVDACMTTLVFEGSMGVQRNEAVVYQTDFHQQLYQCGAGYKTLIDNFYCLHSVRRDPSSSDQLRACDEQLQENMASGFKCDYYNTYINCYRKVYSNECGQGVSKYVCNFKKASIQANTHVCDPSLLQC
ncbi:hypothetical protein QR680_003674 [Steinernema hermaphroditum]|uniref:DUF19 domain-containing protein n=1 Tax=Steinernema hermaphroditum TaxID=289476 RepID=A0AA39HNF8_9BILA|nr:hypothetical protein QR680_003674 [Steinernema hermaphroditum]